MYDLSFDHTDKKQFFENQSDYDYFLQMNFFLIIF